MNGPSRHNWYGDSDLVASLLAEAGVEWTPTSSIPVRERRVTHRPSFAQQRLWALHQVHPEARSAYNLVLPVRISGPLDTNALEESLNDLIARHHVLRSRIVSQHGQPLVDVLPAASVRLNVHDLRRQPEPEQRVAVTGLIAAESNYVFDLDRVPVVRLTLLRTGDDDYTAVMNFHHFVADGWSLGIVIGELSEFYQAHCNGQSPRLADLPIQYGDFAEWQRVRWDEGELDVQLQYWTRQLSDPSYLELPAGRSALRKASFAGALCPLAVPAGLTSTLRQLGQDCGATLFMTLLAAFTALLYRYTAQGDILVGTPVANRNRRELEPLIGFFVNTLILRSSVSRATTFRSLLAQVREVALAAYEAQDVPFEQIVNAVAPDRVTGVNPLPQVMFSLDAGDLPELELAGLQVTPLPIEITSAKFDLTLALTEHQQGLLGGFEYSTELFDADTIGRMVAHFEQLLAGIAAAPDLPISTLPMLLPRETTLVLRDWNDTARDYPSEASIVDVFEAQAEQTMNAVALEFGERIVTYRELNDAADRFAWRLRRAGIRDEECVGVCMNPTADIVVAVLGILKANAVYVPLSPTDPAGRIRSIVAETRMRFVVTQEQLAAVVPDDLVTALYLAAQDDDTHPLPERTRSGGANLAYVIYTSGSTGEPKGIAIPHCAVLRLVLNTDYVPFDVTDRIAQVSTFTFDAITFELWGALLNGACLVGTGREVALSPNRLARFLADARITALFLTSSLFHEIAQALPHAFARVRHLLVGGEAVDPAMAALVLEAGGPERLLNAYGPTETTTFATWFLVQQVARDARTVPIGRPIANSEAYVLDPAMNPVPVGVAGELYLGGEGLARGYWAQPALTADKFRPHPFADHPGRRLYRTGDWVRQLPTGDIDLLGRIDQQVKIRGFRVELSAIEAALMRHPHVRQAAVRSHRHGSHHRLVAYVVPHPGVECDTAHLLAGLRESLPIYMIPAQVVQLERLPLTTGGKLDRKRLLAPDSAREGRSSEPPRSAEERLLAEVWQDILGASVVGVSDNYFELGGDSITAIQIASRLRRAGWDIDPSDIIRRPTIASLASGLRRQSEESRGDRADATGLVPLTPVQRWFFDVHAGDLHHFNQSVLLRPCQPLDVDALRDALQALHRHHDVLRVTYAFTPHIEQRIHPAERPVELEVVDLGNATGRERRLESHATRLQASLTLDEGPLMKAALYRCGESDRLLLVAHHLAVDLMSWRVLVEDLATAYRQRQRGKDIDLGPKSASYKLWAEEIERFSTSPELLQETDYWANQAGAGGPDGDRAPTVNLFGDAQVAFAELDERDTRELLVGVHHAYNTEVNDVMLTALGRALQRWSGSPRHLITLEGHGRERLSRPLDLTRTVGWFTSLHPFRLDLRGDDPGTQLCEIKEALRHVPRKGVGYGVLRYVTPAEHRRNLRFGPRPEISFNYAGQFDDEGGEGLFDLVDQPCGLPVSPRLARQHAIDISSMVVGGKLAISIVFDSARYTSGSIDTLLTHYVAELAALARHCRKRGFTEKTPSDFLASPFSLDQYRRFLQKHHWTAADIEDIYPLAPMQEGLLFQQLYDDTSDAYFIQTICRLDGALDTDAFQESWQRLSRRHAALRTAFVHDDDLPRPLQIVLAERPPAIAVIDLRAMADTEKANVIAEYEAGDRQRRFDLARDPLLRFTVLRLTVTTSHLIWAYPHIILDGWCVGILYSEFLQTYQALRRHEDATLPAAPRYRDYIDWVHRLDQNAARTHWKGLLAGYTTAVTPGRGILTGRARSGEWKIRTHNVPTAVCTRARDVAAQLGVTLHTIVQTAWGLVLSRYNQTRDVVFGTIVSGRPSALAGVESTVGVFINAIPVRIRLARHESVAQLLERVQQAALESEAAQYLPLAEILTQSACGRGLFDHLLVFENYPLGRGPLRTSNSTDADLSVQFVAAHDRTHYDFDLAIVPGDEIQIQIGYTTASYDDAQIERTAAHLERAISEMVRNPAQLADCVDILPAWECECVVHGFNGAAGSFGAAGSLVDLFDEHVQRTPEAVALVAADRSLTYRELSGQVDRLASRLQARGVGPEVLVAIHVDRSIHAVIGMLATLKAGGAYLPLDMAAPPARLALIVNEAKPALLLTERGTTTAWSSDIPREVFDSLDTRIDTVTPLVVPRPDPESLAYVIYTSGTTGRPKGVMVTHRSLLNGARAWRQYYGLDTIAVRMLQMAPFAADVFTGDVARCLASGGVLTICPADVRADPTSLYELIAAHRISIFESTPAMVVPLMEHIFESGLDYSFLRVLIVGSDTLPAAQYRTLVERFGHALRIVNSYGVTEATIESSCFELPSIDDHPGAQDDETSRWSGPTPIGKPLLNMQYLVGDQDGRPMPIGFAGELYIGGAGVARGYFEQPALTAERFIPDPVRRGERLYKSGDVVRWLPDGNLEFLGRADRQIKIRGFRIELAEIEHWLLQDPFVCQGAVRMVSYGDDDKELVAYVVPEEALAGHDTPALRNADDEAVRRFLATKLPEYMVPRHVVTLPRLPLTPHGKVDYAALPLPDVGMDTDAVPSTGEPDTVLRRIWEEVLRVRSVGAHQNFFESGGHSLKAMQLASRVQKEFGVRLSYKEFFADPTLAGLAALIKPRGSAEDSRFASIVRRPQAPDYPLSHAQQRLWLVHQFEGQVAYNMPEAFLLEDDLDLTAVERAFATLVERHEALRTAFVLIDGVPRQKILSTLTPSVRSVDLSAARDPDARARQLAAAEAATPFDLTAPPLVRTVVFRLAPRRHVVLLVLHHIIGDGWSMNVLYGELLAMYRAYCAGLPNPLRPLRIQYADYADWQDRQDVSAAQQYWLERLAGVADRLRLPFDFPQGATRDFAGSIEERQLCTSTTAGLRRVAMSHHTTLANVVLAIFQHMLHLWTGEAEVCVGLSIANRSHRDLENLIGFFVNLLPIRVRMSSDMEFAQLLAQVSALATEALEYQDFPFDQLIEALNPERVGNRQPIVNVVYAFQNFQDVTIDLGVGAVGPVSAVSPFPIPFQTSKFDLTLFVTDEGERLRLTLEYDTGLFRSDTIRRCLDWIERIAGALT